jgi:peptide/nickel transport system substrate-binding protein
VRRALAALAVVAALLGARAFAAPPVVPVETPFFAKDVADGKLPPIEKRLPSEPRIVDFDEPGRAIGKPGGALRILMSRPRDTRIMVVYGYARLVVYDRRYDLVPDILKSVDVEDDRIFTLHLRKGMKWSDGAPFTTEDFRFFWQDMAENKMVSPSGVPREMMVDGVKAKVAVIDATTIRYEWPKPNPAFLPALAGPSPLYIYKPAHYLKRYHTKYQDAKKLAAMVKKAKRRNWAALLNRKDEQYRNDNPDMPTLEPWVLKTRPPSQRFVFERNPYYFRVDRKGHQLPYIDRVVMNLADTKIVPLKTGAGETDLQARYLRFDNYTFLKQAEKRNGYQVRLWREAGGDHMVLYPNLNVADPVWRKLFRDVRFRRALSLATNRHEINQVVFFGLALEGQNTVLPQSPLYKPEYRNAWTKFDLERANALLDEIGIAKRNAEGVRLLPDGRPCEMVVETAGESSEQTDVLELVHDSWRRAGIKIFTRPSQREVLRNRIFSGQTQMAVWSGWENGVPTADTSPEEVAPTSQMQLQWPKWGEYYQTKGKMGEKPDMGPAEDLLALYHDWRGANSRAKRAEIWHKMLAIDADQVFTIGLIGAVPQPVVVNDRLRNVPVEGVYNWDPGAHFGIYQPDTFWWDTAGKAAAARAAR